MKDNHALEIKQTNAKQSAKKQPDTFW